MYIPPPLEILRGISKGLRESAALITKRANEIDDMIRAQEGYSFGIKPLNPDQVESLATAERGATFPVGTPQRRAADAERIRRLVIQFAVGFPIGELSNHLRLTEAYIRSLCIPENDIEFVAGRVVYKSLSKHKADLDTAKAVNVGLEPEAPRVIIQKHFVQRIRGKTAKPRRSTKKKSKP